MTLQSALLWTVLAVITIGHTSHAAEVGWPEAVSRLAAERYKAETCVALLKATKSEAEISRGRLTYANAKSDNDAVIAGLLTTLDEKQQPADLPTLETKLKSSTLGLAEFCKGVSDLLPSTAGQRGLIVDIVKAALEPVLKGLFAGVAALHTNYRQDSELVRERIRTRVEAQRWPDFDKVSAAP